MQSGGQWRASNVSRQMSTVYRLLTYLPDTKCPTRRDSQWIIYEMQRNCLQDLNEMNAQRHTGKQMLRCQCHVAISIVYICTKQRIEISDRFIFNAFRWKIWFSNIKICHQFIGYRNLVSNFRFLISFPKASIFIWVKTKYEQFIFIFIIPPNPNIIYKYWITN